MTRKCIMCKSKNYKNSHSFFSAPKDSETRRLWQEAINIKGYTVNDDTYVCSKHFTKEDIITHWVSGVPPQVITIKYKKCRLRPGAVPVPLNSTDTSVSDNISDSQSNGIILDGKKYFIEPKKKDLDTNSKVRKSEEVSNESLNCNLEDEIYEYIPEDTQEPEELDMEINSTRTPKRQKLTDKSTSNKEQIICSSNSNEEIMLIDCTDIQQNNIELKKSKCNKHLDNLDNKKTILAYLPKRTYIKVKKGLKKTDSKAISENSNQNIDSSINWQDEQITEKFDILKDDMNELNENLNKTDFESVDSAEEIIYCDNTLSFEDFIEIYNEVSLPGSWFASMVSKGHDTTIVYCCMNISSTGMPYVEKKTFLSNNMILRCGVFDKEISIVNIWKTGGNQVAHTLSDIEEFIKEFDQMPICPGIIGEKFVDNSNHAIVTLDGNTWRHSQCSMILNEDQITCLQCACLMKSRKS